MLAPHEGILIALARRVSATSSVSAQPLSFSPTTTVLLRVHKNFQQLCEEHFDMKIFLGGKCFFLFWNREDRERRSAAVAAGSNRGARVRSRPAGACFSILGAGWVQRRGPGRWQARLLPTYGTLLPAATACSLCSAARCHLAAAHRHSLPQLAAAACCRCLLLLKSFVLHE